MFAVEVASRGNTPEELERKRVLYLAHGACVRHSADDALATDFLR
jgi:hypothetical protein